MPGFVAWVDAPVPAVVNEGRIDIILRFQFLPAAGEPCNLARVIESA